MYRPALVTGALLAAVSVILGAFGAHALRHHLPPDAIEVFKTAVQYQMVHSIGLIITGIVYASHPFRTVRWAAWLFIIGILLFSGSLYAITALKLSGSGSLGPIGIITPLGGLCFIVGWCHLATAFIRKK